MGSSRRRDVERSWSGFGWRRNIQHVLFPAAGQNDAAPTSCVLDNCIIAGIERNWICSVDETRAELIGKGGDTAASMDAMRPAAQE